MENFWSLVKRQLHGTYISVEPFHLFRYLDEQSFRYTAGNSLMRSASRLCAPKLLVVVLHGIGSAAKNSPSRERGLNAKGAASENAKPSPSPVSFASLRPFSSASRA